MSVMDFFGGALGVVGAAGAVVGVALLGVEAGAGALGAVVEDKASS